MTWLKPDPLSSLLVSGQSSRARGATTLSCPAIAASNSCRTTPIKSNLPDPSVQLAAAEDPAGCFFILENCFALALGNLLDIDPEQLDYNQPVVNLGIHSS